MAVNPTSFNPKTKSKIGPLVIMIVVAVILAFIAAFGIWQYLNKTQQQVKELTVTRAVVVAAKKIPAGTKLTEADLTTKQFPAQTIPKDYPESIDLIKGRIVKNTIEADEVITQARLVAEGAAGGGLPVVIPPGQRAITVRVNEVSGVGGFINPGDRIDILATLKRNENETFSMTVLQNVLVLAAGDRVLDPNAVADPQPKVVSQITLALNPGDSEKLALASETGQLYFILRPFGEKNSNFSVGASLEDVYGYLPSLNGNQSSVPVISAGTSAANRKSIEIILGDQKTVQYY